MSVSGRGRAVVVAVTWGEINALHLFREGNGCAQRAFVSQLARGAGYVLTWQHLDPPATSRHRPPACAATPSHCGKCSTHSSTAISDRTRSAQLHVLAAVRDCRTSRAGTTVLSRRTDFLCVLRIVVCRADLVCRVRVFAAASPFQVVFGWRVGRLQVRGKG